MNAISQTCMYTTRRAEMSDVKTVLRLFIENLWPIAHFQPDGDSVALEIYNAVDGGRVFVCQRLGEVIGCCAYTVCKPWYLAETLMWDQGIMVIPEHRKTRAASLLLECLKTEARALGKKLLLGANTKNPEAAKTMNKRYRKISEAFVVVE